ncbi:pentatricopeptide repeat-containing protein At4g18840-like [Phoenix dactylifera]|uniref:Pentatricopeptide repeat-containing protein At4g18840-like n=1 Tax=Phoenix dactylifera TaxID=42345 RepID=A0A8B8ZGK6_PHODC|nr:pentatricopeptide repeat-containing protein At4g18840-like [Phoenix dactylifera]
MTPLSPSLHVSTPKHSPLAPRSRPIKPHPAIALLQISRTHGELSQIHSLLIKTALIREKHAFGRLLLSLASLSHSDALEHARKLFDGPDCPKNTFVCNSMIKSYSHFGDPKSALLVFSQMVHEDLVLPDEFTYTFVLNACSKSPLISEGKQVHARMVKTSAWVSTHSWNSLMDFYMKTGEDIWRVRRILCSMHEPDIVSWNCFLDGYVKLGALDDARKFFDEMPQRDTVSWTTLLAGYVNAGLLEEACNLFDEMPERNMVSWSTMINGYARSGRYREALALFKEMQVSDVRVDKITLTTLLSACAGLGAFDQGRWIHAYIDKHGVEVDTHLCTALVDMYGKCGRIDLANEVFRGFLDKKVFLWNAMLGGLAMHSRGKEALELFTEMLDSGIKPNEITFIGVLSACSHSGLVNDGLQIFNSIDKDHDIVPTIEHYGCLVDLLGRAGLLDDAKRVVETMPMAANGSAWKALLGACRLYGDVELGEQVGKILLELEPMDDGNYVLLSNIYAIQNRWEDVGRLRRMMRGKGVSKTPGCSSIEVNGVLHMFIAGDWSHPQSQEIYILLDELAKQFSTNWKQSQLR